MAGKRLRAGAFALLAALALGPLGVACGGPERAARYDDAAHGVSIAYDAGRFTQGTLALSGRITAAEEAAGGGPVTAVEITASDPRASGTGFRVAVFEDSGEMSALGFWRVAEQLIDASLPRVRAAVAPAVAIGEPFQVTVAGLQGYAATIVVGSPEEPAAGFGLALSREPFIYEVIVLCRTADRRLLDELTQVLVDLRLGSGPRLTTP